MAKAAIYLDTRRAIKNGSYPIKIRVTDIKKRKYYSTGFYSTKKQFDKLISKDANNKLRGNNKIIQDRLFEILEKAESIINQMSLFSFARFDDRFLRNKKISHYIFESFEIYIKELKQEERISTAASYQNALNSLRTFAQSSNKHSNNPKFMDLDEGWLLTYEKWMEKNGKSISTIGVYARSLRTIFNKAIKQGLFSKQDHYPFGQDKYQIPSASKKKRALSMEEFTKVYYYDCSANNALNSKYSQSSLENMEKWKSIWVLSYLCAGANFKDIASWKWEQYKVDKIEFLRQKTIGTKRNPEKIIIHLTQQALDIIESYCNEDRSPSNYIFPFFNLQMNSAGREKVRKQTVKNINKWMQRIANNLDIETPISFQTARGSFATILRNSGVSVEYISKALGHSSTEITNHYLGNFEQDQINKANNALIPPKKE